MNIDKLKERYQAAKQHTMSWFDVWRDAYVYAIPSKNIIDKISPGSKLGQRAYDPTAIIGTRRGVSNLISALTPTGEDFAKLSPAQSLPDIQRYEIETELGPINNKFFENIHASNFSQAMNQAYYDLYVGTAAILMHENTTGPSAFRFQHVPLGTYYLEEGPDGQPSTVWRDINNVSVEFINEMWPDAQIPPELNQCMHNNKKVDLVDGTIYLDSERYRYVLWWNNHKLLDIEIKSSPWIIFRWEVREGEIYGRGPIDQARTEILMANEMRKDFITISNFKAMPLFLGDNRSKFNQWNIDLNPGTIIPAAFVDGKSPLETVQMGGDSEFAIELYKEVVQNILNILMASPTVLPNHPVQTATAITIRNQEILSERGPAYGRFHVEFFETFFARGLYILNQRGEIPKITIDNKVISIRAKSPLKQSQELQNALEFEQFYQGLVGMFGPQLSLSMINIPAVVQNYAENRGIDMNQIQNPVQMQQEIQSIIKGLTNPQQTQEVAPQGISQGQLPASIQQRLLAQQGV